MPELVRLLERRLPRHQPGRLRRSISLAGMRWRGISRIQRPV